MNSLLTQEFGKGFDERNLNNMRTFYQAFPIWNAVRTELSWTYKDQSEQIWQMASAKYLEKSLTFFLAITNVNHYIDTSKPAAPLSHMRNSAGLHSNNTLHASRRICAPWRVTFFMAMDQGAV